jgi:Protein of unknown function (DUF2862)
VEGLISLGDAMDIGQKVRVCCIRDRVDKGIAKKLGQVGIIRAYKMADASGVGLVVQFEDQVATWFFEDELEPLQ